MHESVVSLITSFTMFGASYVIEQVGLHVNKIKEPYQHYARVSCGVMNVITISGGIILLFHGLSTFDKKYPEEKVEKKDKRGRKAAIKRLRNRMNYHYGRCNKHYHLGVKHRRKYMRHKKHGDDYHKKLNRYRKMDQQLKKQLK